MKLNTKTIVLTGTEQEIKLSGQNCDIRNDGTDTVYASGEPNITAGADGVMSIPAGQAAKLLSCGGKLYLLGTGSVQLCGNDYAEQVFKCAPASGGSGTVDQTARDTINLHANNTDIHLTAENVAALVSGENLLINGDLRNAINQRGQAEYSATGGGDYTVDGWRGFLTQTATTGNCTITPTDSGVVIDNQTNGSVVFFQRIENYEKLFGDTITVSACVDDAVISATGKPDDSTGRPAYTAAPWGAVAYYVSEGTYAQVELIITSGKTITAEWVKLELGEHTTQFVPPNTATELLKCQRYYQLRSTGDIDPIDLRPTMRGITDIRQRGDGNYEYIAEL